MMKLIDCDIADEKTIVSESAIKCLEAVIEAVREGVVLEVMIVSTMDGGDLNVSYSDQMSTIATIGRLEVLKYRLLQTEDE